MRRRVKVLIIEFCPIYADNVATTTRSTPLRNSTGLRAPQMAQKIPKPKGEVNCRRGYNLKEAMGLSDNEYNLIRVCMFKRLCFYDRLR